MTNINVATLCSPVPHSFSWHNKPVTLIGKLMKNKSMTWITWKSTFIIVVLVLHVIHVVTTGTKLSNCQNVLNFMYLDLLHSRVVVGTNYKHELPENIFRRNVLMNNIHFNHFICIELLWSILTRMQICTIFMKFEEINFRFDWANNCRYMYYYSIV